MNLSKLLVDRDRLMNADSRQVARATVSIFDRIQGMPKAVQLLGLACAFILTASVSGINAQDAFTASKNLMADPLGEQGLSRDFAAMRFHLDTDVVGTNYEAGQ